MIKCEQNVESRVIGICLALAKLRDLMIRKLQGNWDVSIFWILQIRDWDIRNLVVT